MPNKITVENAGKAIGKISPIKAKLAPRYPTLEFDRLKLFFGDPLTIDVEGARGTVTVKSPTLGDIVQIGESRFYSILTIFVGNPTQFRLMLWEAGIDWCETSDFQMFMYMYKELRDQEVIDLLFDGIDFTSFEPYSRTRDDGTEEIYLYDETTDTEITELVIPDGEPRVCECGCQWPSHGVFILGSVRYEHVIGLAAFVRCYCGCILDKGWHARQCYRLPYGRQRFRLDSHGCPHASS